MKLLNCPNCSTLLYFENYNCLTCNTQVGFDIDSFNFVNLTLLPPQSICLNRQSTGCNWVNNNNNNTFCQSCNLTNRRPDINDLDNFSKYALLEKAKRRLIYQLYNFGLPLISKKINFKSGLEFDFINANNTQGIMTGHHSGTITILLNEADSVKREQLRKQMSEPYRTLVGHFRHEIGHYYWNIILDEHNLNQFRILFGDERRDYSKALALYYENGAPDNWSYNYISKYASSHPLEDWAESWAHYMHIMDMLETAHACGISLSPTIGNPDGKSYSYNDPYQKSDFNKLYNKSKVLTNGINNLNRSMGIPDIYPFAVPDAAYDKLNYIHQLVML